MREAENAGGFLHVTVDAMGALTCSGKSRRFLPDHVCVRVLAFLAALCTSAATTVSQIASPPELRLRRPLVAQRQRRHRA